MKQYYNWAKPQITNQEYDIYDYHLGSNTDTVTINGTTHVVVSDIR